MKTPSQIHKGGNRHPDHEARTGVLREMWARGDSVKTIAAAMGVTASAVTGMRSRLQLPTRGSPIVRGPRTPRAENPRHVVSGWRKPVVVKANLPKPKPVLASEPTPNPGHRRCNYPLWAPTEKAGLFCGAPIGRAPYCDHHRLACTARRVPVEAPHENP